MTGHNYNHLDKSHSTSLILLFLNFLKSSSLTYFFDPWHAINSHGNQASLNDYQASANQPRSVNDR